MPAYDMRISYWISDVCSSDLDVDAALPLSVSEDRAIVARHVHCAYPRSLASVHRRFAHPPDRDLHDLSGLRARAAVPMGHVGDRRGFDLVGIPARIRRVAGGRYLARGPPRGAWALGR